MLSCCSSEPDKTSMVLKFPPASCTPRFRETDHSKRKRFDPFDCETSSRFESGDVPKSCLTEQEIQRVVSEELKLVKSDLKEVRKEQKRLKSHLADLIRSCIRNTLKEEVVPVICSALEDTSRRVVREELMKHASSQSAQLASSGDVRPKDGMSEGLNPVATDLTLIARGQT